MGFSERTECWEESEDWLPDFSILEGCEGESTGVGFGELCDKAEIAAIALAAGLFSSGGEPLRASTFVTSVLTIGEEALAKEPERRALGFSEDRVSMLDDEPVEDILPRLRADLTVFRA
jgi:hypothetical protein